MKAIEFPEVNVRIAANQPEYETLPAHMEGLKDTGWRKVTVCFYLDPEERKQVIETGQIWQTIIQPDTDYFHPILMSTLKPEL
ncbi:MAG: hypothetical protein AAGU19_07925 [Prolixibacteraceae bacterium]